MCRAVMPRAKSKARATPAHTAIKLPPSPCRPANNVDLSAADVAFPGESLSGFGDEHSGQFNANIQSLKPFYDPLLDEFEVKPSTP